MGHFIRKVMLCCLSPSKLISWHLKTKPVHWQHCGVTFTRILTSTWSTLYQFRKGCCICSFFYLCIWFAGSRPRGYSVSSISLASLNLADNESVHTDKRMSRWAYFQCRHTSHLICEITCLTDCLLEVNLLQSMQRFSFISYGNEFGDFWDMLEFASAL